MQIDHGIKKKIIENCLLELENKLRLSRNSMNDIKEGISNETKSSAGDKFETAREMMQQEYSKLQLQIQRLSLNKDFLISLKTQRSEQVQAGSLIKSANNYILFIAGFTGFEFENIKVHTVAINSPLGQTLKGMKKGECKKFKENEYCIDMIV